MAALGSLYEAERADGSGVFAVSLQIMAAMLVVAGIAATLIPSDFSSDHPTVMLCVPVLAWGLSTYTVIVNALMAARVHSIGLIEVELLAVAAGGGHDLRGKPVASNAGDWATNVVRQPWILKICTIVAYLSAYSAVIGVSIYVVADTAPRVSTRETLTFGIGYGFLALVVLASFVYIYSGRLVGRMEKMSKEVVL